MSQISKPSRREGTSAFYSGVRYKNMNEAGQAIASRLGGRLMHRRLVRRSWLDSFDWRLYAAALVLEQHQYGTGSVFVLRKHTDGRVVAKHTGECDSAPGVQARDLRNPSRLRDIVPSAALEVLHGRGLHVLASCRERVWEYVLEDRHAQITLRLQLSRRLERVTPVRPSLRLQLYGIAGHEAALARAHALLYRQTRFQRIDQDPVSCGTIGGRGPGQVLTWRVPDLGRATRADQAFRLIFAHYANVMESLQPHLQCGDIEFVHEFRIGVRRLRSILPHMKGVFSRADLDSNKRILESLAALTGSVRDADVQIATARSRLRASSDAAAPEAAAVICWFIRLSERQRIEAHAASREFLASIAFRRAWSRFRRTLAAPPDNAELQRLSPPRRLPGIAPGAGLKPSNLAAEAIARQFVRVLARVRKIRSTSRPQRLHELRKTLKKLRYTVDACLPLCSSVAKSPIHKPLKELLDLLGILQDGEVLDKKLKLLEKSIEHADVVFDDVDAARRFVSAWRKRIERKDKRLRARLERSIERLMKKARKSRFPPPLNA